MVEFKLLRTVMNLGAASHIMKIAKESGVCEATVSIGYGSGSKHSRLSDFLGLSEERKEIIDMIADKETIDKVVRDICEGVKIDKPHHGIAFTVSLSETTKEDTQHSEVKDKMYKLITVIVDKGFAEDVIDVAKKAGARGATIVNAREVNAEETHILFSVEVEPEKEKVLLIVKTELKADIVEAIKDYLAPDGEGEESKGMLYVIDIDEIYGLHE